ncbi:unnamed protein product, partial [Symbiodinium microadriaticum]
RIRKLKELARIAAEAEIEKWIEGGTYSNEHISKAEDHFPVAKSYPSWEANLVTSLHLSIYQRLADPNLVGQPGNENGCLRMAGSLEPKLKLTGCAKEIHEPRASDKEE